MRVYLDVLAVLNFGIDLVLLYAVAVVVGFPVRFSRLALGALIGAVYGVLAVLPAWPGLLTGPLASLAAACLMLAAAFWPLSWRQAATVLLWFHGFGLALGGLAALTGNLAGAMVPQAIFWPNPLPPWWGAPVGALFIFILGRAAWRSARRLRIAARHQVAVSIEIQGQRIDVTAQIDTGHDAQDPLSGQPVTVIEAAALPFLWRHKLPPDGAAAGAGPQSHPRGPVAAAMTEPSFDLIWQHLHTGPLAARVRLFPFRSLGMEYGLLAALRVDCLQVHTEGQVLTHKGAIVALYPGKLAADGLYQALLPPQLAEAP